MFDSYYLMDLTKKQIVSFRNGYPTTQLQDPTVSYPSLHFIFFGKILVSPTVSKTPEFCQKIASLSLNHGWLLSFQKGAHGCWFTSKISPNIGGRPSQNSCPTNGTAPQARSSQSSSSAAGRVHFRSLLEEVNWAEIRCKPADGSRLRGASMDRALLRSQPSRLVSQQKVCARDGGKWGGEFREDIALRRELWRGEAMSQQKKGRGSLRCSEVFV